MKKIIQFFKDYWITISIYIGAVILYIVLTETEYLSPFLFPDAEQIKNAFISNKENMILNMFASFGLMIPAIAISLVIALSVGTILGLKPRLRKVLHPIVYTVSVVPSILMAPFALLLAPSFRAASLFLVVYSTIWSTLFATITGIQTIDKRYLDNAETLEITGFERLVKVIFPAASPSILAGFVNSLRGSFVVLVYAEMYGAKYGMGYFVKKNAEISLYDKTWAGFIFMVFVLVIVMQFFEKLKNRILKWTI